MQRQSRQAAKRLLNEAWRYIRQGDAQRALPACKKLNQQFPEFAAGWLASSHLLGMLNMPAQALQTVEQAVALEPQNPEFSIRRALCLLDNGRSEEGLALALSLAERPPEEARLCADLAQLLIRLERHEAAKALYEKAVALQPDNGTFHLNLAIVHQFLGELQAAAEECDRAIELDHGNHDAYLLRSSLARQTEASNHVDELRRALSGSLRDPVGEAKMQYALAKELEDLERYPESFAALASGAAAYRSQLDYDVKDDVAFIDQIIDTYDAPTMQRLAGGFDNEEAVFILGLPRTGSTLLERIIGSHSKVFSAGELTHFTRRLVEMTAARHPGARPSRVEMVRLTTAIDFAALGRAYIESTRPLTGRTARFIDKFPPNSLNVGAIHLALPKAKIVLLERHPMDTCYAIFKQLFTDIYHFSYDLVELGRYFVAHDRLMRHWQGTLPGLVHVVRYEDLVERTEDTARAVLDHCGLEWQPACLDFHRNRQASRTASASQVRRKVYSTSVGRWRCYEQELEPLREMLDAAGCLESWSA